MFENLLKHLEELQRNAELSVPLAADADGYFDKECPLPTCLFEFKIHSEDWPGLASKDNVHCPSCGHQAHSESWYTTAQISNAPTYAKNQIINDLNDAMRRDAADFNARQPAASFIKMSLSVEGGSNSVLLPIAAADPMRLRTTCEDCGCRFAYVGAAFFCPACGLNSATNTFAQTLEAIRAAARSAEILRTHLSPDDAHNVHRQLLEKGIQDTVTAFQRLCEKRYELAKRPTPRRNAFQSLDEGSALWAAAGASPYDTILGDAEMSRLRKYFQQRHLLAHQQGLVDQDYITRSGDTTYALGQRIIVKDAAVLDFVDLVERLATRLG